MEVCSYDPNHTVPCRSMENHKTTCLLNQLGYSKEEQVWKDSLETIRILRNGLLCAACTKMICPSQSGASCVFLGRDV